MRLKQQIDEKETPQSLRNLKKAIVMFFFLLIGTAFAVLALNQIQNN